MPIKGFLKTCFETAVHRLEAALLPGRLRTRLDEANDNKIFPPSSDRALTDGETALVKSIFGRAFRTKGVRKYFSPSTKMAQRWGYVVPATTFGQDIKFYGAQYDAADFSQTQDLYNYGTFLHEMVHVWQNRHPLRQAFHKARHPTTDYGYQLTPRSHFRDFGEEQQASIIEDYARQFLFLGRRVGLAGTEEYLPSAAASNDAASMRSLALLKKVVEERFPAARRTRLRLQAQRDFPPTPPGL